MCLFADDSTYTKSNSDPLILKQEIDEKYQLIANYMAKNKLILNSDKTHLLVMAYKASHRKRQDFDITLKNGTEIVKPIQCEKLLGAIISNDLGWNQHVKDHKNSMFKILTSRVNALSKLCRVSDFKTHKMIANGIFMSNLTGLIQLWSGCSEFLLTFLQVIHNRAARLVTRLSLNTRMDELLKQVGWLSVRQLGVYHSLAKKFEKKFGRTTRLSTGNGIKQDEQIKNKTAKQNFSFRAVCN